MNELNSDEALFARNGAWSRTRLRSLGLAGLAAVGIYLCYRLAQPCIPSLVWAGALALVFTPMHRWIETRVKRPNLAAILSLAVIALLVVVPATWFAQKVVEQVMSVPQAMQKQIAAGKWHADAEAHPYMARILALVAQHVGSSDNASRAMAWLNTMASRLITESAIAAVGVSLTLYFLFYFLRDRVHVLNDIRSLLPLTESESDTLFHRIRDTTHATLCGMLVLSGLQGLLGGLMYFWLGIPSPWFWALLMAAFAFVPVIDMLVLWLPAAVYLGLEGRWGEALGLAGLGTLLVRAVENFLYPILVRDRLKVPSVGIFISLLGGLLVFGWSGLVLGPVVLTTTAVLLELCAKRLAEPRPPVRNAFNGVAE